MATTNPTTPLVRDHLPKTSRQAKPDSALRATPPPDVAEPDQPKTQGRATRSPADIATRRHLEGAEQGPM